MHYYYLFDANYKFLNKVTLEPLYFPVLFLYVLGRPKIPNEATVAHKIIDHCLATNCA